MRLHKDIALWRRAGNDARRIEYVDVCDGYASHEIVEANTKFEFESSSYLESSEQRGLN